MSRRVRLTGALVICAAAACAAVLAAGAGAVSGTDVITTIAGSGTKAFAGDGGPATSAALNNPSDVAFDSAGNLFIADFLNNRVRKVTPAGVITTIVGTGQDGSAGDGGQATAAALGRPSGLAFDNAGNLFISQDFAHRVRKVTPAGVITTVAGIGTQGSGGDGGPATAAQLAFPGSLAVDAGGNLYIADPNNRRVRKVTPAGVISTVAGPGTLGTLGDGGQATAAYLNRPTGLALDTAGNLYIADGLDHRVRKVTPAGVITTVAGTGTAGFSGDGGQATAAAVNTPVALAIDGAGNLYIADNGNARVRKVAQDGVITTVAGTGVEGILGDGGPAGSAQMKAPGGLALDAAGNLYVVDLSQRVRKITVGAAPAAPTPGAQTGDVAVEADVIAVTAAKSRLGKRVVRIELSLRENVSATLTLGRGQTTLATKGFATVREGERVLTLRVPAGTARGKATLMFEITDQAGNTLSGRRGVRIAGA